MKVKDYLFSLINGVYEPLVNGTIWQSGTQLNTDAYSNDIPLPFPFSVDNTAYNSIRIYNNGFITLGKGLNNGTIMLANVKAPISNTVNAWANDYVISGFGNNLCASTLGTPQISFGQNLSNDFVIQFQDLSIVGFNQTRVNFQIILKPNGTIQIVYGANLVGQSGVVSPQVGLRGKAELINNIYIYNDWQTRKVASGSNWNILESNPNYPNNVNGVSNTVTCSWNNVATLPNAGLTFEWKP